jgi:hypothetical protein
MIPIGYLYKRVSTNPDWLHAPAVKDIYALSGCISEDFADYVPYWKHNGYWLFDSPTSMNELAKQHSISLLGLKLFYYEAYELEFDEEQNGWFAFEPEASFGVNVEAPARKILEGFDITTFSLRNAPECSPLSCNSCAEKLPTNEHRLFPSFEAAKTAIESGAMKACEPGPYRIIAVYSALAMPDSLVD